jgi:hypothetical protein
MYRVCASRDMEVTVVVYLRYVDPRLVLISVGAAQVVFLTDTIRTLVCLITLQSELVSS